jgi:hypothetical protein
MPAKPAWRALVTSNIASVSTRKMKSPKPPCAIRPASASSKPSRFASLDQVGCIAPSRWRAVRIGLRRPQRGLAQNGAARNVHEGVAIGGIGTRKLYRRPRLAAQSTVEPNQIAEIRRRSQRMADDDIWAQRGPPQAFAFQRAGEILVPKIEIGREVAAVVLARWRLVDALCVPKTLSELMTRWNRLSWRNDRAALFRSGRPGLAIQVEVAA